MEPISTWKRILSLILVCLVTQPYVQNAIAQQAESWSEAGNLPIRYIDTSLHGASTENWSMVQDEKGILYVANSEGLLIHDGISWELIDLPKDDIVRSLAIGHDGTLYAGSAGDLGYFAPDSLGKPAFTSLVDKLSPQDQAFLDVWETIALDEGVYFYTDYNLFRWQDGVMDSWPSDSLYRHVFTNGETLFVQRGEELLYLTDRDSLQALVITGTPLSETLRLAPDGPRHILGISREGIIRCAIVFTGSSTCSMMETEIDAFMQQSRPFNVQRLIDGNLSVGFDGQGVALVSTEGSLLSMIGEGQGLMNLEVMNQFIDHEGALWLMLYDGLARIEISNQWSSFGRSEGLPSKVSDIKRWKNVLFAATMLGIYQMVPGEGQEPPRFEMLPDNYNLPFCFNLAIIQDNLLASCATGIAHIKVEPGQIASAKVIYPGYFEQIIPDPTSPSSLYAAGEDGLFKLRFEGDELKLVRNEPVALYVSKIFHEPRKPDQSYSRIWAIATQQELYRIDIPDNESAWQVALMGAKNNLLASPTSVSIFNDTIQVATEQGLYSLSGHTDDTPLFSLAPSTAGSELYFVGMDLQDRPYILDDDTLKVLDYKTQGELALTSHSLSQRIQTLHEIEAFFHDKNNSLWLAHSRGVIRLADQDTATPLSTPTVHVKTVTNLNRDSLIYHGLNPGAALPSIPFKEGSLRFDYAAQIYDMPEYVQYRVRLDGIDKEWSKWTKENMKEYRMLREGTYAFYVQARTLSGATSEIVSLPFTITPPWYRTSWAYWFWVVCGSLVFFGLLRILNQYQTFRLKTRNKMLNRLIEEQTEEIKQKNLSLSTAYHQSQLINKNLTQTNLTLQQTTNRLRETIEANKEILSITAHDLKNPLGGIIGLAEMVIQDFEDGVEATFESAADNIPTLKEEAERMLVIIQDLLDRYRDGEKNPLRKDKVLMDDIIAAVFRWNAKQAKDKAIQLYFKPHEVFIVEVDVMAIQRVLDNYVSNAIKYSSPGSRVWVEHKNVASPNGKGRNIKVTVRDEGPGLTEEDKRKAFQKMQRLSATPTAGEHSSGLGLYIVKKLVHAHNGTVGVDSVHGKGASFWFTLPLVDLAAEQKASSSLLGQV